MNNKKLSSLRTPQKINHYLSRFIFSSRWLQAPLYMGLVFALLTYVYLFLHELKDLIFLIKGFNEQQMMMGVLELIDVVMIANLLIMVIMGGYQTFVANLTIDNELDQPEWLSHIDAGAMKVKLALALIGISSIDLLRTFINPAKYSNTAVGWQVGIHLTLLISVLVIALTNRLLSKK